MLSYRWIAMLDILGFRRMVQTRPVEDLALLVERLFNVAQPRDAEFHSSTPGRGWQKRSLKLGHLHFSDTIMLWTPPLHPNDPELNTHMFLNLCQNVAEL